MNKFTLVTAVVAAIAGAGVASAATTVTQTVTFPQTLTDFTASGTFNLFDSTLGTLTAVNITDSYGFTTTIKVTNTGTAGSYGTVSTGSYLQLGSTDAALNTAFGSLDNQQYVTGVDAGGNLTAFDYNVSATSATQGYNLGVGGTTTLGQVSASGNSANTLTSYLAAFVANGSTTTGNVTFGTLTNTNQSNHGGNTDTSQVTNAQGSFTINYTYDAAAVPEPATWGMMVLGFGVIGAASRRRRNTNVAFHG